jgi:hypothetical protein
LCDDTEDTENYDVCQSATLGFADSDSKDIDGYDVDVLCDASEDYEAHKEHCDKLYDSVEEDATLAFASSEEEEHCEDNNGDWSKEDKTCNFDDEDDTKEYAEEKFRDFANKPENRNNRDWEYDEDS